MNLIEIQDVLSPFFDEILITNSNPHILKTVSVFKVGGEVKYLTKNESFYLSKLEGDNYLNSIINELIKSDIKNIDFYPKGILKYLKSNKIMNIKPFIDNLSENHFIITSKKIKSYLKLDCPVYENVELKDDLLIIGERSRLIIKESDEIEVNFDKSKFSILNLF